MSNDQSEWRRKVIRGWKAFQTNLLLVSVLVAGFSATAMAQAVTFQNASSQGAGSRNAYVQKNLVADKSGIAHTTDSNLVNAWGIARNPTGPWWVNDNGSGVSTLYNGTGDPFPLNSPLTVTIPLPNGGSGKSAPTGIVFNGTKDFEIEATHPARFIFVTEDGTISGWNPDVDQTNAIIKSDNSDKNAVYKGAALALADGVPRLYAADFHNGSIAVFDTDFKPVTLPQGAFKNSAIPNGFAPFNIANVDGRLFVMYAKQDADKKDDVSGAGNGYVDVFTPEGKLVMSLKHGPWFNSPWGAVLSPNNFGKLSNMILIGNFGSGQIAAFDPINGNFQGFMKKANGNNVDIDGLWALGFGNGRTAGPTDTLFFSAGPNGEKNGLFGTLTPSQ